MGWTTIINIKKKFFARAYSFDIIVDDKYIGTVLSGKSISFYTDDNIHYIYCIYRGFRNTKIKSNIVVVENAQDNRFTLESEYKKGHTKRKIQIFLKKL